MNTITLTESHIRAGATSGVQRNGNTYHSWKSCQIRLLAGKKYKGWLKELIGTEVSESKYRQFLKMNPKCPGLSKPPDNTRRYLKSELPF